MLMSMTGFGKATGNFQDKKVSIEIRSLNSKTLDLNVRMSSAYREIEAEIRKVISAYMDRGKVDVNINVDNTGDSKNYTLNKDLAKAYYADLKEVNELIGEKSVDYLAMILKMPDILINEREEIGQEEKDWILELTKEACENMNEFRRQEGIALEVEFTERIEDIINGTQAVQANHLVKLTIVVCNCQGFIFIDTQSFFLHFGICIICSAGCLGTTNHPCNQFLLWYFHGQYYIDGCSMFTEQGVQRFRLWLGAGKPVKQKSIHACVCCNGSTNHADHYCIRHKLSSIHE